MGCFQSKTKEAEEKKEKKEKTEKGEKEGPNKKSSEPSQIPSTIDKEVSTHHSLEVPIPRQANEASNAHQDSSVSEEPSAKRPSHPFWGTDTDTESTSSSAPVLFRISPVADREEDGSLWDWWHDQIRRGKLTHDGYSRIQLHDLPNRLQFQYEEDRSNVEMDLSNSYLERTAPFVLGQLLSTPSPTKLCCITSLRLDGNYFSDSGFGNMLSTIAEVNDRALLFPVLQQLHLRNMNLDANTVSGVLAFLFPIDYVAAQRFSVPVPAVLEDYHRNSSPSTPGPLFPAIQVLSLSDNPGLGEEGITRILEHLLTYHYEDHKLSVLDVSRCDIPKSSGRRITQFLKDLIEAQKEETRPVVVNHLVMIGNNVGGIRSKKLQLHRNYFIIYFRERLIVVVFVIRLYPLFFFVFFIYLFIIYLYLYFTNYILYHLTRKYTPFTPLFISSVLYYHY